MNQYLYEIEPEEDEEMESDDEPVEYYDEPDDAAMEQAAFERLP